MATQKTILVLGGNGKTGKRVAERLWTKGFTVRIGSRSATPSFDWEDRSTWRPALKGIAAVYISYYPDIAVPGAVEIVSALAHVAVDAGVERLVLLSGRGEPEAERAEDTVLKSGAEATILRASWFNQNFSEGNFVDLVLSGEVALPAADVPVPFLDADDIADVAVAALTEPGHAGKTYDLTGPRALTFRQAVAEIAGAAGRDIRYTPISLETFAAQLTEAQVPADVVSLLRYLFSEVVIEENGHPGDGVRQALGRGAKDFRTYAREAAASGIWG